MGAKAHDGTLRVMSLGRNWLGRISLLSYCIEHEPGSQRDVVSFSSSEYSNIFNLLRQTRMFCLDDIKPPQLHGEKPPQRRFIVSNPPRLYRIVFFPSSSFGSQISQVRYTSQLQATTKSRRLKEDKLDSTSPISLKQPGCRLLLKRQKTLSTPSSTKPNKA